MYFKAVMQKLAVRTRAAKPHNTFAKRFLIFAILGTMLAQFVPSVPGEPISEQQWKVIADGRWFASPYSDTIVRSQENVLELSSDGGDSFDAISNPFEDLDGLRRLAARHDPQRTRHTRLGQRKCFAVR